MKTTELKFRRLDEFPAVKKLRDKLEEIRRMSDENKRELDDLERRRLAHAAKRTRDEDAAAALVRGDEAKGEMDAPDLETIQQLRQRQKVLDLARSIGEGALKEAQAKASLEVCDEARPQFTQAWQELGKRLAAVGEAAARIEDWYGELDSAGIMRSTLQVCFSLEGLDQRRCDNRLNGWVNEIETEYDVRIDRPLLDAAEKVRLAGHHDLERRKAAVRAEEEAERGRKRILSVRRGKRQEAQT